MIALDTNILIYAVAHDEAKSAAAQSIVLRAALAGSIVPVQVLAEFANACRRKGILSADRVNARIDEIAGSFVTPATAITDIDQANALADRYHISFFNSLICVVSKNAGASVLLSEDLQDGMTLDGITVINPLVAANAASFGDLLPVG